MLGIWKHIFLVLTLSVILLFLAGIPLFFDSRLHLVFCDVGQGDGILIYKQTMQILVDGGPDQKILKCLEKHVPFWDRKIEFVVLTNPDLDHYGGLIDVNRNYKIKNFAHPGVGKSDLGFEVLEKEVGGIRDIRVIRLEKGNKVKMGEINFEAIWPEREDIELLSNEVSSKSKVLGAKVAASSPNEYSAVLFIEYGDFQALLTGDIEPPATDRVAEELDGTRGIRGDLEVLKVPHHGSKNGLTQKLLDAVKPKLAVISAGKNNRFGHPHKETLKLLSNKAIKLLRTDQEGEIEVVTDGKSWEVTQ